MVIVLYFLQQGRIHLPEDSSVETYDSDRPCISFYEELFVQKRTMWFTPVFLSMKSSVQKLVMWLNRVFCFFFMTKILV